MPLWAVVTTRDCVTTMCLMCTHVYLCVCTSFVGVVQFCTCGLVPICVSSACKLSVALPFFFFSANWGFGYRFWLTYIKGKGHKAEVDCYPEKNWGQYLGFLFYLDGLHPRKEGKEKMATEETTVAPVRTSVHRTQVQRWVRPGIVGSARKHLRAMGVAAMPDAAPATSTVDPSNLARRQMALAFKQNELTLGLWFDNYDDRQYAHIPIRTSAHRDVFTVVCAFPVRTKDARWTNLPFYIRDPPVPTCGLTVVGVRALWNTMSHTAGAPRRPVPVHNYDCWPDIPWTTFRNMGFTNCTGQATSWEVTLPVLPSSKYDNITAQPTKHWQPLEISQEPTSSVQGRTFGLESVTEWAKLFYKHKRAVLPVVLDYDTWYNLLKARLDAKSRGVGLYNVLPLLDMWHILKYTTLSFMELIAPLFPTINQALYGTLDTPLRLFKVSQQQWFMCVLGLAYQNQSLSFCEMEFDAGVGDVFVSFVEYLSAVFDTALPLCWGAWWLYREGKTQKLLNVLMRLLPLLSYCSHDNYVFGVAYHCSLLMSGSGAVLPWLKGGMSRLGSAEVGEMAFKFVADGVRTTTVHSDVKIVKRALFELPEFWKASSHCRQLFGVHSKRVYRACVSHDSKWVKNMVNWFEDVGAHLQVGKVYNVVYPTAGSWLQPALRSRVADYLVSRSMVVVQKEPEYLKTLDRYGYGKLRRAVNTAFRDGGELPTDPDSLKGRSTEWQKWLDDKNGNRSPGEINSTYTPFTQPKFLWNKVGGFEWVYAEDYDAGELSQESEVEEEEDPLPSPIKTKPTKRPRLESDSDDDITGGKLKLTKSQKKQKTG